MARGSYPNPSIDPNLAKTPTGRGSCEYENPGCPSAFVRKTWKSKPACVASTNPAGLHCGSGKGERLPSSKKEGGCYLRGKQGNRLVASSQPKICGHKGIRKGVGEALPKAKFSRRGTQQQPRVVWGAVVGNQTNKPVCQG